MLKPELPKRKPQRLHNYNYSQNGAYFVTICTKNKQNILGDIKVQTNLPDQSMLQLSLQGQIVEKYLTQMPGMVKYVIMPNHIHALITILAAKEPVQNLSTIVRSFKIMVTKACESPIWQRSFYDHIVRNENDYRRI